jgi:hypothetical protein
MNQSSRLRYRASVMLHMVTAFVVVILLVQLWLFTIAIEAVDNGAMSFTVESAAAACSFVACMTVWGLIRLFLRAEN